MFHLALEMSKEPAFDFLPEVYSASIIGSTESAPRSLRLAMLAYDSAEWQAACNKEVELLANKKVWVLVDRPLTKIVIWGMWLFKCKVEQDGAIK